MAESRRSVTAVLRAEISDYKSKMKEAQAVTKGVGDEAAKSSSRSKSSFDTMAKSIDSHEQSLNTVAKGFGAVGLAAAVGFGAAVKSAATFDAAMSDVKASGEDARLNQEALRASALKWGADTKYSATEAAGGIENLMKAGVSATDVMGGGLEGALNLAASGNLDVAGSAELAATAMTQFGLKGKDVPHIADLIAAGAGKAQGEVGDLGAALNQSGLVASQFGLSIEDTTGTLAAFASAGLIGSDAGTSFKTMLLSLANPSAKTALLMEQLGINAYDAQGNFVGITDLAGQLQSQLGGLTQAQRDQALAQIFGNDAVRAANVLYKQGSDGIGQWITDTNDAGYAAETAATRMDNLQGDLEQLQGAFETALIGAGQGQQAPLRDLVQGLTGVVDKWNELGEATQTNIARVVGALAAIGLGGAAVIKVVQGAAAMRTSFLDLGLAGGPISALRELRSGVDSNAKALTAMGRAGRIAQLSLPVVGLALTAVTTAVIMFNEKGGLAKQQAEDFGSAMEGLAGHVDAATVALDDNVRAVAVKQLQDAGAFQSARDLGVSLDTVTDAALGNSDAMAIVAAAIEQANAEQDVYTLGQGRSGNVMNEVNKSAINLGSALGITKEAVIQATLAERDRRQAMGTSTKQTGEAETATDSFTAAVEANEKSAEQAEQDIEALAKSIFEYTKKAIAAENAAIGYEQALDDVNKEAKEGKKTLDIHTQAGRDNRQALINMATAAQGLIEEQVRQGKSTREVKNTTKDAREEFIRVAEKMGASSAQAKKLADRYGLIPKDVKTHVSAPGAEATKREVDNLIETVRKVNGKTVTIKYNVLAGGTAVKVQGHGNIVAEARAAGGPIRGAGTGTSDDVPIWASNGEYMQTTAAHQYYGTQAMDAIRSRRIPKELLAGFATGGPIDKDLIYKTVMPKASGFLASGLESTEAIIEKATIGALQKWATSIGTGGAVAPVPGGYDRHSGYPWASFAADFPVAFGTPVKAWKSGLVSDVERWGHSYGNHIRMNHGDGTKSLYAHLSQILADEGDRVAAGTTIGKVGSTGNSSGPHLHLETIGGPYTTGGGVGASWDGRAVGNLSREQLNNAATIISVARGLNGGDRAATIGIMTAMVESGLRNVNYGHLDSLGLFQQRAAWGPASLRTNPAAASRMFYLGGQQGQEGLFDKNWRSGNMGALAQAVQVSQFPGRYAQQEGLARSLVARGGYANGTDSASRGWHATGERGAELVLSPQSRWYDGGERVLNAQRTAALIAGGGDRITRQELVSAVATIVDSRPMIDRVVASDPKAVAEQLDLARSRKLTQMGVGLRR